MQVASINRLRQKNSSLRYFINNPTTQYINRHWAHCLRAGDMTSILPGIHAPASSVRQAHLHEAQSSQTIQPFLDLVGIFAGWS
jgi:hypothetical protein